MLTNAEIGIDLGTANTLVYSKTKGIIINEPSVVSYDTITKKILAVGNEAKAMIGKTPEHIIAMKPLKEGVIADFDTTTEMLRQMIAKASKILSFSLRKPLVAVSTPSGSTSVDRRAIQDAVKNAGAKKVFVIEGPVAAAIGAGLPVDEPIANVVIDFGGGATEVAIISFGGVVTCHTVKIGGDQLDDDIIQHIRKKYNVLIGDRSAENVKMEIGYALIDHKELNMEIRGRDLVNGLPKIITVSSYEIRDTIKESLLQILEAVRATLEDSPAELSGDIVDRGIILTGGGALLHGMEDWLSQKIDVPVTMADNPLHCAAIGTGKALDYVKKLNSTVKA